MKTAVEILKSHVDELSQHNGSYTSYKHTDAEWKETMLSAMEEYADQFRKTEESVTREKIKSIIDDSFGCDMFNCKGRGNCTNTEGTTYTCKAVERHIDLLMNLFIHQ